VRVSVAVHQATGVFCMAPHGDTFAIPVRAWALCGFDPTTPVLPAGILGRCCYSQRLHGSLRCAAFLCCWVGEGCSIMPMALCPYAMLAYQGLLLLLL
jgi:hypothetical protein